MQLPPKRFEDPWDHRFDDIRHKPWYAKLIKRREKLPSLKCAADYLHQGSLQKDAAARFTVDERELRDYVSFIANCPYHKPPEYYRILEEAYAEYCGMNGDRHINYFIERIAPSYGMNPRHVTEMWEIDPTFYPVSYAKTK